MTWNRSNSAIAALLMLGCLAVAANAANDSRTVIFRATVHAKARLTVGSNSVTFPDVDPGTVYGWWKDDALVAVALLGRPRLMARYRKQLMELEL